MIVKRIPAKPQGLGRGISRAAHARQVLDYISTPDKPSPYVQHLLAYLRDEGMEVRDVERVLHTGARGFVCDDARSQRAEMAAVAEGAVRSPNPIDHWLLSWRKGEHPSKAEVDGTVDLFLHGLGLHGHQAVYALHGDTHNHHVHIAVNRYDPLARKVLTIEKGFYKEAAHKAVARIVDQFGWQAERNARYVIKDGEPVKAASARERDAAGTRPVAREAAAYEVRTGYRSAQRIAQDDALPVITAARSWREMHEQLAARGITYEQVGTNGAMLIVDGQRVKVSNVHRGVTVTALTKRFGTPFQPRAADVSVATRDIDRDIMPDAFRADEYRAACEVARQGRAGTGAERETRVSDRATKLKATTDAVRELDWTGKEAERDLIMVAFRRGLDGRKGRKRVPLPPDLESWLYEQNETWFARRWRERDQPAPPELVLSGVARIAYAPAAEIDGYQPYPVRGGTRYARDDEGTAFIDFGDRIRVTPGSADDAVLAALRLASMRFKEGVRVQGSPEFQKRVFDLAIKHGLAGAITNSEFVARQQARQHLASRKQPNPPADAAVRASVNPVPHVTTADPAAVSRAKRGGLFAQAGALLKPASNQADGSRAIGPTPRNAPEPPTVGSRGRGDRDV